MDAETFRRESRERWESSAAGWEKRRPAFQRATLTVSAWLVDHVARNQVIDSSMSLLAWETQVCSRRRTCSRRHGALLITDGAEAMVQAARRRARKLDLPGVEAQAMEAEALDVADARFDGVLCRWGYMLLADPARGLREAKRALAPGGRIAFSAWTDQSANPWHSSIGQALVDSGADDGRTPAQSSPDRSLQRRWHNRSVVERRWLLRPVRRAA